MFVKQTTWLRAGASQDTKALGEIGTGIAVHVLGCAQGWCYVEFDLGYGYVPQSLLSAAGPIRTAPKPGEECLPATHFTAEGPIAESVCPAIQVAR